MEELIKVWKCNIIKPHRQTLICNIEKDSCISFVSFLNGIGGALSLGSSLMQFPFLYNSISIPPLLFIGYLFLSNYFLPLYRIASKIA
jgi:hypothetical protein